MPSMNAMTRRRPMGVLSRFQLQLVNVTCKSQYHAGSHRSCEPVPGGYEVGFAKRFSRQSNLPDPAGLRVSAAVFPSVPSSAVVQPPGRNLNYW